jgi:hypothetical protein
MLRYFFHLRRAAIKEIGKKVAMVVIVRRRRRMNNLCSGRL